MAGNDAHVLHLPRICSLNAAAISVPVVPLSKGLWQGGEAIGIARLASFWLISIIDDDDGGCRGHADYAMWFVEGKEGKGIRVWACNRTYARGTQHAITHEPMAYSCCGGFLESQSQEVECEMMNYVTTRIVETHTVTRRK